ncbi:hypothetical protein GLAREA_04121 [Glarea lozoyensis ATCC 20868]|uniref:Heterokaryon incompatibility domain-containing protein n=1 Tax=Glarea lozoyensis (strain ATCC 20868 / MF5171) TaxID=1116229 RepID=S3D1V7_GLAL2|nr:uncharacterized protein GLAREA_04121 [Glarea lozoyensis ATCC 20868]EPE31154.1 hypothetical protein GLAREA_04121 [Glarea lozoyensis ATCC 20868]
MSEEKDTASRSSLDRFKGKQDGLITLAIATSVLLFTMLNDTGKEKNEPQFRYPTLDPTTDGIRLLILRPGERGSMIECDLKSLTFEDNPTYDALSYEWGDDTQHEPVWLNGSKVLVREHLWYALHSLRDRNVRKALWVDFLCIDQTNPLEKNRQIPLMGFIYRRARQVVIWLGLHNQPVDKEHEQKLGYAKSVDTRAKQLAEIKLEYFVHGLIHEGYWNRAWIIQEVGMASTIMVYFGTESMEWNDFVKLLNWYREKNSNDAATQTVIKLDAMRRSKFTQKGNFSLQNLVDGFRDAFCTLQHDKVYAFIGLANDTVEEEIPINYQKSIPEVYHDIMRHHFHSLQLESQQTSSIDAVYFAALVRRLLTREKTQLPRIIKTFQEAITKDLTKKDTSTDYSHSQKESTKEIAKDRPEANGNDVGIFSKTSAGLGILPSLFGTGMNINTKKTGSKKEDKDSKYSYWRSENLIPLGVAGVAGAAMIAWLLKKYLEDDQKPKENLTWYWKESSLEDLSAWIKTSNIENESPEFLLRGAIVSRLEHLGPSISDLATSHQAEKCWKVELGCYLRKSNVENLSIVRGLNEKLLSMIGKTTQFCNRNIVSFSSHQTITNLTPHIVANHDEDVSHVSPVLFIGSNQTLGVTPANVREGDFICQFWNSSACAVLRETGSSDPHPKFEIIGRAAMVGKEEGSEWEVPGDKLQFTEESSLKSDLVDLRVSTSTLTWLSLDTVFLPGTIE